MGIKRFGLIAAIGYGVFLGGGAYGVKTATQNGLQAAQAMGVPVTFDSVHTLTSPAALTARVDEVAYTGPVSVTAPWIKVNVPVTALTTVRLTTPEVMNVGLAGGWTELATDDLTASATFAASTEAALRGAAVTADKLVLGNTGWAGQGLDLQMKQGLTPTDYDVTLDLAELALPTDQHPPIAPVHLVGAFSTDVTVAFNTGTPWRLTALRITEASIVWGDITAKASGDLKADANGQAEGVVQLNVTEWQGLIGLLAEAGLIDPQTVGGLTSIAKGLEAPDGSLSLPLSFGGGVIRIGFIPVGPAPYLQ